MESKESMGLPSPGHGAVISSTPSFNGMHQRNPEMTAPATTTTSTSLAVPVATRPQQHLPISDAAIAISAPIVTSVSSSAATHLTTPPPYATTDMSTAIVPHSAGTANIGAHSAGATATGGNINFGGGATEPVKKKRGRPRKYGPHGSIALSVAPISSIPSPMSPSQKRGRGRPPGSGKNQQIAALGELMSSSAGAGFTPHAITVAAGEDVAAKIMSFSQQGPRGICILSANGAISNVTLRQAAISGGTVNYEGRFEILSLSGSFLVTESGGTRSRSGGLSVSLAGPDGRVIGGGVAGMLMAASPVQVVVGSFIYNARKGQPQVPNPNPSKIEVHTGFSRLFSVGMPSIGNSGPNSSINEMTEVNPATSESPMRNQSAGAADSSNADESSQDQEDEE